MIIRPSVVLALLTLLAAPVQSQEGPHVPCVDCENFTYAPFPEPGHWYNPDQSGSGFNLEFQNGMMAGYYFGYDSEGEPEWYLVTNPLVRSETPGVMWELEVEPQRFTGGNCMGCPYQPPSNLEVLPAIKIEFLQRAYARLTLSDGSTQYMVPIMYGASGKAFFAEQTPYKLPVLPSSEPFLWTLLFKRVGEENEPWNWFLDVYLIEEAQTPDTGVYEGKLFYFVNGLTSPPEIFLPFGFIVCDLNVAVGEPNCILEANGLNPSEPPEFSISIGNFTDTRIFGETEGGDTVQGHRLDYD